MAGFTTPLLSEYDYKLARSCLTKLYYRKHNYPTNNSFTAYDRCLTDGVFMIYALAQVYLQPLLAVECGSSLELGTQLTLDLLQAPQVTLWEPVLVAGGKAARPFVLRKSHQVYELIYVATKGGKVLRHPKSQKIQSEWLSPLLSLAFQQLILAELVPAGQIKCSLLLPDRDFVAQGDNYHWGFRLYRQPRGEVLSRFSGVRLDIAAGHRIPLQKFFTLVDVTAEVAEVRTEIQPEVNRLLHLLAEGLPKPIVPLDKHCKDCEFKVEGVGGKDGFRECWGELAQTKHHIFDFYHGTRLHNGSKTIVRHLVEQGQASMFAVPLEALAENFHGQRQRIQLHYTAHNQEWLSPDILPILASFTYPLRFIDFETARLALPPCRGLSPYTIVAFQWSCHTIPAPGAPPQHQSWLSLEKDFPNWEFARTLKEYLGDGGTVLTWGMHEYTVLKEIANQMERTNHPDRCTRDWLIHLPPLVDLHALTLKYYFHPRMGGRTSLKRVFPAIWQTNPYLHSLSWLQEYVKDTIANPYAQLDRYQLLDREVVIQEGMEAALAYHEFHYGSAKGNPLWGKLLEQYCRLDTMAMVVVWWHWSYLSRQLSIPPVGK
ncbi:MAG: DUF2779 domain-containing protein [Pseudanabaenaceae cyanobacterium SKYGB_i_bin29]|nr:DUF2779 domain-containing protein [Pseudanabaenaceae cyanobacterium SKYG29]MDW8420593.1 DUF2779 domain-containing protein [Pseudanabaenaceae cyanobacterium SKYGB_i_bin29]